MSLPTRPTAALRRLDAAALTLVTLTVLAASSGCRRRHYETPPTFPARVAAPVADLALFGGHVVTVDPARPEAQAVAVQGDRILAVGSDADIRRYVGASTRTIDLAGRLLMPGFIEGHGHYTSLGESKTILDLTTARSWDDIVAMVRDAAAKARPGEWVRGRGWHREKWTSVPVPNVEGVPLHASLSAVSPNNP